MSRFYILPADKVDIIRMERLIALHRESCDAVYTLCHTKSNDSRDLCLLSSGHWYTAPFEMILPFQIISNDLPSLTGVNNLGHQRFVTLDSHLRINAKAE